MEDNVTKQAREEYRRKLDYQKMHMQMKRAAGTFEKRDRAAKLLDQLLSIVPPELLQPAIDWVLEKEGK